MAYTEHLVTKPEVIAKTAVGLIFDELLLSNLVTATSFTDFKGSADDTVNIKVPGLLPARSYAFRNDRSKPIEFDQYTESKVPLTFSAGRLYSAVELTDEQNDFDDLTVNQLMPVQAKAVARGIEHDVALTITGGDYEVGVQNVERDPYRGLVLARQVLNKFRAAGKRMLVVGSDFEAALLLDKRFTAYYSSGDKASSVLESGRIGSWVGFDIFVSDLIAPDEAIAFTDSAFAAVTAAPYIPNSVPFGATASADGYSLRWIRDYDPRFMVDRSVVDCYFGSTQVKDRGFVVRETVAEKDQSTGGKDTTVNTVVWKEKVLDGAFNVRAIKLKLGGSLTVKQSDNADDLLDHLKITNAHSGVITVPAPPRGDVPDVGDSE